MPKWGPSNPLWRWQHRRGRKTTRRKRRAHTKAPKVRTMARRRYGRKRRGGRRNFLSKFGGVTGLATSANAANQLGVFDAAQQAMTGDFQGAASTLAARATSPQAIITAIMPMVVVTVTKKALRTFGAKLPSWV